jgi:transcriptional regulator GlxA family with amidase domain
MKITIVAFEGCMTSAVYGQADAFAIAAYISGRRLDASWTGHDVRIATSDGRPVQGYGGHLIEAHCSLGDARDSNVVLIPPIFNDIEATLKQETGLIAWLNSFPQRTALLASTCTGAFLLAEAGILNGRRVTTNPAFSALFEQRYPAVRLALEERIIDDNMVICAGATTARSILSTGSPVTIWRSRRRKRCRSTAIRNRSFRISCSSRQRITATTRCCSFRASSKPIIANRSASTIW